MRRGALAALTATVLLSPPRPAQSEPVLHEYVPPVGGEASYVESIRQQAAATSRLSQHLEQLVSAARGLPTQRQGRLRRFDLDRTTTLEDVLRYEATFEPSVMPLKRNGTLDAVGDDLSLYLRDTNLQRLPVRNRPTPPGRIAFRGTLVLRMRRDVALPIPSVAPNATILAYAAHPPVAVQFFKDGADNYWVKGAHSGLLHLVWLSDAPRSYFSPRIDAGKRIDDIPPTLVPRLGKRVREQAHRVIDHIGLRGKSYGRQLDRLVAYFRNFADGPMPRAEASAYLDVSLSQRGVCRHRSHAFVVTAQALGIPARFVHNDAHAFVEVFVPRAGWIRIDLGGAARGIQLEGRPVEAFHRPAPDPFARPYRFTGSYSQRRPSSTAARRSTPARVTSTGGRTEAARGEEGPPAVGPRAGADPRPMGDERGPTNMQRSFPATIRSSRTSAFRGDQLTVWGQTASVSRPTTLAVDVFLIPDGRSTRVLVGSAVARPGGRYRMDITLAGDLAAGDYELQAEARIR